MVKRCFQRIAWRSVVVCGKFAEPERFVKCREGRELLYQAGASAGIMPWIIMRLIKIQSKFRPRTHPIQPRRAERHWHAAILAHGLNYLLRETPKIRKVHFRGRLAVELADGPFGFVGDFPGKKRWMPAKCLERRNQDALQKSFAAGGELKHLFVRVSRGFSSMVLQPQMVDKREANLDIATAGKFEGRLHVAQQEFIRAQRYSLFGAKTAAAVPKKELAHHARAAIVNAREIICNQASVLRERKPTMTRAACSEVFRVVRPRVIHAKQKWLLRHGDTANEISGQLIGIALPAANTGAAA